MGRKEREAISKAKEGLGHEEEEKDPPKDELGEDDKERDVEMSDAETQTEEIYFEMHEEQTLSASPEREPTAAVQNRSTQTPDSTPPLPRKPIDRVTARIYKLPLIDALKEKQVASLATRIQLSKRVGSIESPMHSSRKQNSLMHSQKSHEASQGDSRLDRKGDDMAFKPRSIESTRRMLHVFNDFSKSQVLRRFNQQYPEIAPDLRRYSIKEGKRHFINGRHAYYFH